MTLTLLLPHSTQNQSRQLAISGNGVASGRIRYLRAQITEIDGERLPLKPLARLAF